MKISNKQFGVIVVIAICVFIYLMTRKVGFSGIYGLGTKRILIKDTPDENTFLLFEPRGMDDIETKKEYKNPSKEWININYDRINTNKIKFVRENEKYTMTLKDNNNIIISIKGVDYIWRDMGWWDIHF
jgi:hypothetical protein